MQTDVLSGHLNTSGFVFTNRTRLRGLIAVGSNTAGTINIWDTTTAPTSVTYARTGTTITVTHTAHGYSAGQSIGLTFAAGTGGTATNGNYVIATVPTADTYTVVDLNSGSITAGAAATEGTRWLVSMDSANNSAVATLLIPAEGIVARNGLYLQLSNQTGVTVFYG
jgi:WD40 repeat protein